ncbi:glycosyltransferase family 4 protein [Rhodobacteraceae bacterium CCMM004]|nr:glycosyltransferase family 4 protein [Rhodobacteraceae bacterium CCMM004]
MEAHSYHLAHGLADRGHDVTLFAAGDSRVRVRLRPLVDEGYETAMPWHSYHGTETLNRHADAAFAGALPELAGGGFDIVHNNALHRYPPRLARRDRVPMVTSLHVPPFDALHRAVRESDAPWSRFTVTSAVQARTWWPEGAPDAAHVVPNGIDLTAWPFSPRGDGGAVWAGRIAPNKGAHLAVRAARLAGLPLTLYGAVEHPDYFDAEVRPLLGGSVRYAGHVTGAQLARALGGASVCLFTPLWNEPFGLVAAEAMACGTPVAATPQGATAEVVGAPGGVVATDLSAEALAAAALAAAALDRRCVHAFACARYGIDRMIGAYEALYARAMEAVAAPAPEVDFPPIELPPRALCAAPLVA